MPDSDDVHVRALVRADLEAAIAAIRDGGWGERGASLQFYVGHAQCYPIVAETQGKIVGTAVATCSGRVGWLGLVFVAPAARGRGLGACLTRASLDVLTSLGCRSVLLAATDLGQPIYSRLGFVVDGTYSVWTGPRAASAPTDPRVRRLTPDDLPAIAALDARATGEERAHALRALTHGWVITEDGQVTAYALRTPWGFGPAIAEHTADGALLLDVLLGHVPTARGSIITPTANAPAAEHLRARGFVLERELRRMRLGDPVPWQPTSIWAIFNFGMG